MYQGGSTPLILAAWYGQLPVVEYLLERRANMEAKNSVSGVIISCEITHMSQMNILWMYQNGRTALTTASNKGHLRVVEHLVERGADMETKNGVSGVI